MGIESIGITNNIIYMIKMFFIYIYTYYISIKVLNAKFQKDKVFKVIIYAVFSSVLCMIMKKQVDFSGIIIFIVFSISIIFSMNESKGIGKSIIINLFSISINYCIYIIATILAFIIFYIVKIKNEYMNFLVIIIIYTIIVILSLKIPKVKYGINFFKGNQNNKVFDILVLNISLILIFSFTVLAGLDMKARGNTFIALIIFSIIMFITIQKSLELYYKQKLQKRELEETREELKKVKEEKDELQKENLKISKEKHSIVYNQEKLEYKINQLLLKNETSEELQIKDKIEEISNKIRNEDVTIELTKTGIEEIDDMLKYMQAKCKKNNINFELQVKGNIHHMINKYIEKKDLEILLADHIKNAIIAINYSKNINKSILVKLGIIDGVYSVYFYDTGTEFNKETLLNLGKKPSTTHADNGGTGMGFLNTFDKLKKYKASITINEYGKPCEDNYTKYIAIKFDNKNEYQIHSYRFAEMKSKICRNGDVSK